MRKIILFGAMLLLASCAAPRLDVDGVADVNAVQAGGGEAPSPAPAPFSPGTVFTPVKAFLEPGTEYGATISKTAPRAYIIFGKKAKTKGTRACEAFNTLKPTGAASLNPDAVNVPTYWMLASTAKNGSCKELVRSYDYNLSADLSTSYGLPNSAGLYVLAIDQNNKYFYIDLTEATAQQTTDAIRNWASISQSLAPSAPGTMIENDDLITKVAL